MNRTLSRKLAGKVTNLQLKEMLSKAKKSIKDWSKPSAANKSMTKCAAWDILAANFDENKQYPTITKINMIHEFGDFLSLDVKEQFKNKENKEVFPF